MDYVASIAQGQEFVEIGSSKGDLIECVSRVTKRAWSIENNPFYCNTLRKRAAKSQERWSLKCESFPTPHTPDSGVYFAWIYYNMNVPFLSLIRKLMVEDKIRKTAVLMLAFSGPEYRRMGRTDEHTCWSNGLRPFARQFVDVPWYEGAGKRESGISHVRECI